MDRVFASGAVGVPPTAPATPSIGYPTAGDPIGGIPAAHPGPWWYYMVTEELRGVVAGAGLTPDHTNVNQLAQAIAKLVQAGQRSVILDSAVFAPAVSGTGNVVYWDSANSRFDLALADGSTKQNAVGVADVANSKVYAFGDAVLFSGMTPGARYYLDATTAGTITATAPTNAVFVGIAKTATELFVDIDAAGAAPASVGSVMYYPAAAAPTGYLKANGAAVSRTAYAALFAVVGGTFGVGDGVTTFNLPDLRGEFLRGLDDGRGVDTGRALGSAQADDFKSHTHNITSASLVISTGGNQAYLYGTTGTPSGATGGTETRPRNVALLACIKY